MRSWVGALSIAWISLAIAGCGWGHDAGSATKQTKAAALSARSLERSLLRLGRQAAIAQAGQLPKQRGPVPTAAHCREAGHTSPPQFACTVTIRGRPERFLFHARADGCYEARGDVRRAWVVIWGC